MKDVLDRYPIKRDEGSELTIDSDFWFEKDLSRPRRNRADSANSFQSNFVSITAKTAR
jgi:hypothetical protein